MKRSTTKSHVRMDLDAIRKQAGTQKVLFDLALDEWSDDLDTFVEVLRSTADAIDQDCREPETFFGFSRETIRE